MPKHVASRTLEHTTWNASILEGDAPTAVAELKRQEGENLLKFGSGSFSKTLLEHGLIDELHLWIFPVLAGGGQRLIEGIQPLHLQLAETTPFSTGLVVNTYTPK